MSQMKRGRRTPFKCGHRGLGGHCHRCAQADALDAQYGGVTEESIALRSTSRGPTPAALDHLRRSFSAPQVFVGRVS